MFFYFSSLYSFGEMLEEAESRKLLQLQRDEKSGGYVITGVG